MNSTPPPPSATTQQQQQQQPPPPSQYALYAAMQTMKKRCQTLQQRLTSVEEENLALRQRTVSATFVEAETAARSSTTTTTRVGRGASGNNAERDQLVRDLQLQVQQLALARQQATDRLTMIATENRQLWARLSQLAKAPDTIDVDAAIDDAPTAISPSSVAHQNLIRSKTFTQNAPNPALRVKMTAVEGGGNLSDASALAPESSRAVDDISLEEISLKVLNEFLVKKAEAEKLCTAIGADADGDGEDANELRTTGVGASSDGSDSFGFGFLSDDAVEAQSATDLQLELKRCADGMADIRKEVLCQQSDIKVALSSLRQRRFLDVCPSCKHHLRHAALKSSSGGGGGGSAPADTTSSAASTPPVHIDLMEQKRLADALDKMCPMCAKLYSSTTSFDAFQEHVESHFVDDSELDSSFDRNFELVSQTVGDF